MHLTQRPSPSRSGPPTDHDRLPGKTVRRRLRIAIASALSIASGVLGIQPADGITAVSHLARRPPIGTLSSPVLGAPIAVYEGVASAKPALVTSSSLDVPGAVHIPQTARPGSLGVAVVAAHRTTWPRPFYRLDKLAIGDRLTYTSADGAVTTYVVVQTKVVRNDAAAFAEVMNDEVRFGSDTRLTLYACSRANGRPTSTLFRLVVSAVKLQPAGPS